ncbi:MAG: ATP-binding protein [Enterococcus sp.]
MRSKKNPERLLILVVLAAIFFTSWQLISHYYQSQIIEQQEEYLIKKGNLLIHQLDTTDLDSTKNQKLIDTFIDQSTERITLMDEEGTILLDTSDPTLNGSRNNRPEVKSVIDGAANGKSLRKSDTVHEELLYVALPILNDGQHVSILRIAEPTAGFLPHTESFRKSIFALFFFFFLVLSGLIYYLIYKRNRPYQTVLPVLKKMVDSPEQTEIIMQESGQFEELYQTVNLLSEQMSETYRAYTTTEEQFHALLQELMLGVFLIDDEGTLLLCNPKMQTYLGLLASPESRLYTEVIQETQLIHLIHQVSATHPLVEEEIKFNEQPYILDMTLRYFENSDGTGQILGVANDLTRIRRLEKVQRDFVGNVSHELKTPVTSLIGFTETLLDGAKEDPDVLTEFLTIIQKDAHRLDRLIHEIIQLSKGDEAVYSEQSIHFPELVTQLIQAYQPFIQRKNLKVEVIGEQLPPFMGKYELLQPIVKNLLENAIQYSPQDSRIIIRYTKDNEQLTFSIRDFGIGIDKEDQERIFERFYRVDKARSRHSGGTGLGLAIVRDYVKQLGGTIRVTSHPGLGSTFIVTLPQGG